MKKIFILLILIPFTLFGQHGRTVHGHGGIGISSIYSYSGWTHSGTYIYPTVLTDYVGIGTATPTTRLTVNGNITSTGTVTSVGGFVFSGGYGLTKSTIILSGESYMRNHGAFPLYIVTQNAGYPLVLGKYQGYQCPIIITNFATACGDSGKFTIGTNTHGDSLVNIITNTTASGLYCNGGGYFGGRVSIGTSTPYHILDINTAGAENGIAITNAATDSSWIAPDSVNLCNGAFRIDNNGQVGIGTSPNEKLDVSSTENGGNAVFKVTNLGTGYTASYNRNVSSASKPVVIYQQINSAAATPCIGIRQADADQPAIGIGTTDATGSYSWVVRGDARTGIGTASPIKTLSVAGSIKNTGTATSVLTGSIDPTASTSVVGVGTAFTTELVVGDRITVSGETRYVTAIADATHLTVGTAFSDNANDTSPDKLESELVIFDSAGNMDFIVDDQGYVGIGTTPGTRSLKVAGSVESSAAIYATTFALQSSGNIGYSGDGTVNIGIGGDDKIYLNLGSGDSLAVVNSSSQQVFRVSPSGVGWFLGALTAASYADNTPLCSPNWAWNHINEIKPESYFVNGWSELDDDTLPGLLKIESGGEIKRNVGATVSFNLAFGQEAKSRIENLEYENKVLNEKIDFLMAEIKKLKTEK